MRCWTVQLCTSLWFGVRRSKCVWLKWSPGCHILYDTVRACLTLCHPALGPPRLPQAPDPHPFSPPSWHVCFVNDHIVHWSILQASSESSINVTSMKVTLGAALALGRWDKHRRGDSADTFSTTAASASAFPVRIITLSGPPSDENAIVRIHAPMNDEAPSRSIWGDKPCHEMARLASEQHGPSAPPQGPLGALLARLGLMPEDAHRHSANRFEITTAVREHDGEHRAIDAVEAWKHHVQEMIHGAEDKVLPIMQGGSIRILPIMNENGEFAPHVGQDGPEHYPGHGHHRHHDHDREQGWKSLEGKGGVKKHHHKHQSGRYHGYSFQQAKTFSCR